MKHEISQVPYQQSVSQTVENEISIEIISFKVSTLIYYFRLKNFTENHCRCFWFYLDKQLQEKKMKI